MQKLLTTQVCSFADLRQGTAEFFNTLNGAAVVCDRNKFVGYVVSVEEFERLKDIEERFAKQVLPKEADGK